MKILSFPDPDGPIITVSFPSSTSTSMIRKFLLIVEKKCQNFCWILKVFHLDFEVS